MEKKPQTKPKPTYLILKLHMEDCSFSTLKNLAFSIGLPEKHVFLQMAWN